jgi:hypothetical protein
VVDAECVEGKPGAPPCGPSVQNALQSRAAAGRANGELEDPGVNTVFFKPSEMIMVEMPPRRVVRCLDCSVEVFANAARRMGKYVKITMDIDKICQIFISDGERLIYTHNKIKKLIKDV